MKTSNKLIIAFAVLMFVVPLTIMAYTINKNYKDPEEIKKQEDANLHFNTPSVGFNSIALQKTFKSISVTGKTQSTKTWGINLVTDKDYGVKVPETFKDLIEVSVDVNGQLHITFKGEIKDVWSPIVIYVYASRIEELNVSSLNEMVLRFKDKTEALQLNVKDVNTLDLREEFNVNNLSVDAEKVNGLDLGGEGVRSLSLNLRSSNFNSDRKSYDSLNISASEGSGLNIIGDHQNKDSIAINQLTLNTSGEVDVNIANIKLNAVSGSLSDETMIKMPISYLKKMIK